MKPPFWDQACAELCSRDAVMARLIPACGPIHLVARGDPFTTLARAIVGQQISVKAAASVWNRFDAACRQVSPQRVARMRIETLRGCGLSQRKAEYVKDLARHFVSGEVDPSHWPERDDESIIEELVAVRGIGRWTAEMFLIFNLLRPDVLPVDDLGLVRGIEKNYRNGESVSRTEARQIGESWRPWRTVATWYLWRSLEPGTAEI
ncbi:MAG: DNA-3-methyladenine glycosylase 2 family protein [Limnobacter sp.]|mgnify:CR=1 FL=1|nr:DNA-3-methyladenine glycosylase 2 family protein [Limnobacter sp.]